ncbi:TraR/DksA family transcriptional regulator [Gallaecimonas kandeliae]|uniref:TraR/DksA family transcriptional regulator n=1 Tax=Gallaecimonas kandeliae TaxID=3029055 RepID=UPI002647BFC7|nr:TraR/DksA family transcriptional regulator [Gallaecimonas kandeliae]WKE64351.1 TraR/DksA family transcriptional regulator [Gallaecimonas kandeliae]
MPDLFDAAQNLEENQRQQALSNHKNRPHERQDIDAEGRVWCLDCPVQVPPERLAKVPDACRCIDCQQITELKDRQLHGLAR